MPRITRLGAFLLATLLLFASPSLAECKDKDGKAKNSDSAPVESNSESPSETPESEEAEGVEKPAVCEPVGVQVTPLPPGVGVDRDCLPPVLVVFES